MTSWTDGVVSLRRADAEDWQLVYAQLQDSAGHYHYDTTVDPPITEAAAEELWADILAANAESGRLDLAICVDGEVVGKVSLVLRDEHNGCFVAPVFLLPEYRGQGYGRRAMALLLAYAFDERRLHKWQASVLASNAASIALHESFGCVREGCFRQQIWHDGQWHDEIWFGLTEAEWRAAR